MTVEEKAKKVSKKEKTKLTRKKVEKEVSTKEVSTPTSTSTPIDGQIPPIKIEELIHWSDEKCAGLKVPLIEIRNTLILLAQAENRLRQVENDYNILRAVFMTGAFKAYSVECPQCHKVTEVLPQDLIREENVTCPDCNCSYNQTKCITGILTVEEKKEKND